MKKIILGLMLVFFATILADTVHAGLCDDLTSYWDLDGAGAESSVPDSYSTNNGSITGTTSWVSGKINNALDFDGTSGGVTISDNNSLDSTTPITVAFWMNPDTLKPYQGLVMRGGLMSATTAQPWVVELRGDSIYFTIAASASSYDQIYASGVTVNEWQHVAAVIDTDNIRIFRNGTQVAEGARTVTPAITDADMTIAGPTDYAPGYFDGQIDEFGLWDAALTGGPAGEIAQLYNNGDGVNPLANSSTVPELPPGAMQMMLLAFGGGFAYKKWTLTRFVR